MKNGFGAVDSLAISDEINIPLVIIYNKKLDKKTYHGFVPGLTKNDVVDENVELCKNKLKEVAKEIIVKHKKNNLPFPYFPSKDEILQDFQNVCYLSFIKLKK